MMRRTTQRGFTLIELMAVIAIIGVVSALLVSVNSSTYGGSPATTSDQLSSTMNYVKMRAVSTRRIHDVYIRPNEIQIWQSPITGFKVATLADGDPAFVNRVKLGGNVRIFHVEPTAVTTTGTSITENTALDHKLSFRPDGSVSTGATLYVTDLQGSKQYRVLVYKATGSSYARAIW